MILKGQVPNMLLFPWFLRGQLLSLILVVHVEQLVSCLNFLDNNLWPRYLEW